ncbi:chymotrypsinogen protein 3 [Danaus plexippus plexippus]|uniref:Chymotrypsinogen protein 3 n=1 Tax=Danaus plexippus plexippus TaxID=278856 RepID=A0A212F7I7_DANPL|nr:chymotrypsinogen protein 3 [Danaus plexippus plexippus]
MIKIVCWSFLLLAGSYGLPLDSDVDTSMYFGNIDPVLIESSVAGPVPYMVAVTHGLAPRVFQCGASLITTRHFLTTAGCVYFTGESRRHLQGTVGTNLWNSGGTHYSVVRVIIHREYSMFTYKNDISILVTSSEVKLSEAVQPVVLNYDFIPAKVAAVVNGWGVTNVTEFKSPTMLMELQTNIVDGKECAADIADLAKKLKRPVHHGDGGSPLVLKENRQQIGIVSWGITCAKGVPDVYTRISAFKSWIQKNTIL